MDLQGRRVLIVGLGKSGLAAARLCLNLGAQVTATDLAPQPAGAAELAAAGAALSLGGHREDDFQAADLVVLSPGVDPRRPEIARARERGAEVIGELELGWRFLPAPAVMVTGTNGKSTVTTLVGRMLAASGRRVFVGGNLGTPLCDFLLRGQEVDWAVLEVSSFQTDTMARLRPAVGVVLNLSPDHLDRYTDFTAYADSKFRLLANQAGDDVAVLCMDDPEVAARAGRAPARVWGYGAQEAHQPGGWLEDGRLVLCPSPGETIAIDAAHSPLVGTFNRLNLLAASLAALAAGADPWAIQASVQAFRGLPHRLQSVGRHQGRFWFDDSKATNLAAVKAAVAALDRPLLLLLGGRAKEGCSFAVLAPELAGPVQGVVAFGEAGPAIARELEGLTRLELVADLPAAVEAARRMTQEGDTVLLAPGCSSFDAYDSYAQRGQHFQALVKGEPWRN